MARFEVSGIEGMQDRLLKREAAATKAVPKMLKAGGAVLVKAQQEEIRRLSLIHISEPTRPY